jgi:hypothetical protein
MSNKSTASVATMGIDIGKNPFHVVGLDERVNRWFIARSIRKPIAHANGEKNKSRPPINA